jgi:hypothetical protein
MNNKPNDPTQILNLMTHQPTDPDDEYNQSDPTDNEPNNLTDSDNESSNSTAQQTQQIMMRCFSNTL